MRILRFGILAACVSLLASGCDRSEDYPSRPITLVCPWAVGGGTDRVSRQVAVFLEEELDVPVNVVNTTGGQGVTGHSAGLHAKPDGYTIAMMTLELNMLHWRKLTSLTWRDCEPLMSVNEDAAALFVRADAPWDTLDDLRDAIVENPGTLKASGTASLGAWHLALAGWLISMERNPRDVVWVPQTGAGPSLQEMMSGGLDMVCCSLPEARNLYLQGELRCLGVMSEKRVSSETFRDVPTFREQGFDWTLVGWRGLGVPVGTPEPVQEKLVAALKRIVTGETTVNGETFPQFMAKQEFDHTWRATDDFREFLARNDELFGRILNREEFADVNSGPIGPMSFPNVLFALLAAITVALGVQRLSGHAVPMDDPPPSPTLGSRIDFLLVVAAVAVYIYAADVLGFVLTAGLLLFVLLWRLGTRLLASLALTLVLTPALYQLFAGVLRVPLPHGMLGW